MKIAHLSDLHVLSLEGVPRMRFLNKRITGYANLRFKRTHKHRPAYVRALLREITKVAPDHVVITGDLTNLALEPEFEAVRKILEEELGLSPNDVSIVPGNHDLYTRGALVSRRFTAYFGDYITSDLPELAAGVALGPFPFVRLRGRAAIIGLSSAVPRLPLVASGKLGDAQLAALDRVLAHPEVRARTPVILLHHPAHNPLSRVKARLEGLDDATLLWTSVRDVARGMVLHGHLHRRIQRALPTNAGKLHAVGATSASLHHEDTDRMAGFNLYSIEDSGEVGPIEAHVFNPETERFAIDSVPKIV